MKTTVEIEWDEPREQHWLCADNIAIALSAYCKNTKFIVREVDTKKGLVSSTQATQTQEVSPALFLDSPDKNNSFDKTAQAEIKTLRAQVKVLERGLEFYAEDSQFDDGTPMSGQAKRDMDDYGWMARQALESARKLGET